MIDWRYKNKLKMKIIRVIILVIVIAGCKKEIEVTSVRDIPGLWKWEYTCGEPGDDYECITGSKTNYATINFGNEGLYIEKHNDTVFLETNYSLVNYDDIFGTLILEDPPEHRPVTVMDNRLLITRGIFLDSYIKIR